MTKNLMPKTGRDTESRGRGVKTVINNLGTTWGEGGLFQPGALSPQALTPSPGHCPPPSPSTSIQRRNSERVDRGGRCGSRLIQPAAS